jgi:lysyl-tRNA synthetase class I
VPLRDFGENYQASIREDANQYRGILTKSEKKFLNSIFELIKRDSSISSLKAFVIYKVELKKKNGSYYPFQEIYKTIFLQELGG